MRKITKKHGVPQNIEVTNCIGRRIRSRMYATKTCINAKTSWRIKCRQRVWAHIQKGISTFPGLAFACLDACMKGWAQRGCEKKKRDKDKSTAKTCLGNDII